MSSAGFAAILARLQATELRSHCNEALRLELVQVQHRMFELRAAMHRLRDVNKAAIAMGNPTAVKDQAVSLNSCVVQQRSLGRAVSQFNAVVNLSSVRPSVCCACKKPVEEPLLSAPDAAALSPPRRSKPEKRAENTSKKRKLEVPATADAPRAPKVEVQPKEEPSDDHLDPRSRLSRRIDACWPLASTIGALEMHQRRNSDYVELVERVTAVFQVISECHEDDMTSRGMRSMIVKARDSLAVAVSVLNLQEASSSNASIILELAQAVDSAKEKHQTLQKHVALFRDSLAELEFQLLTRNLIRDPQIAANLPRQKLRTGR